MPDWVFGVRPSTTPAPASAMFRRRWTSASVTDREGLCCAVLGYLHLACGSLTGGCSVFLGFKGGLGHKEGRDDFERSMSVGNCR